MKRKYMIPVFLFCYCANTQQLTIGDTVPDVVIRDIFNYKDSTLRISDFRGKLVILDFWTFTCAPCLWAFPKVDSLQKEFGDQLQFITVNPERKAETGAFFAKRVKVKKPDVPMITSDTLLKQLFVHNSVPAHVWIGPDGKVLYLADLFQVTRENITNVLKGQPASIPVDRPKIYIKNLFLPELDSSVETYSYLSHCDPFMLVQGDGGDTASLTFPCYTVVQLYQAAFEGRGKQAIFFSRPGRTVVESSRQELFNAPSQRSDITDWMRKNSYNFQYRRTRSSEDERYQDMTETIDQYFGMEARVEQRMTDCWTLVQTGSDAPLRTKGGEQAEHFYQTLYYSEAKDSVRYLLNTPFPVFVSKMQQLIEEYIGPFRSEIRYGGNVDITVKGDALDEMSIPLLRQELKKYNLDLVQKKVRMPVLVIRDRKRFG